MRACSIENATSMLEAGWSQFENEFFRYRVELQAKVLDQLIGRFNSVVVAASIIAGFAFTALVEMWFAKVWSREVLRQRRY